MFSVLALASAVFYGAADFIGGMTSRRADTMAVVVVSQFAGLLMVALVLPVLGTPVPAAPDWVWGSVAGIAGGVGVALLYRALAVGVMSLVAPVTAVLAVTVPVVVAVAVMGERPALVASIGIVIALVAVVLVSQAATAPAPDGATVSMPRRGLGLALMSGVAIGGFFVALAQTSQSAGLWPLLSARVSSVLFFAALMLAARRPPMMPPTVAAIAIAGGTLDMIANLLYLLAARQGPLTLAVTLSSLYPASTVLLARVVLHERLTSRQWIGVALALVAIILIVSA